MVPDVAVDPAISPGHWPQMPRLGPLQERCYCDDAGCIAVRVHHQAALATNEDAAFSVGSIDHEAMETGLGCVHRVHFHIPHSSLISDRPDGRVKDIVWDVVDLFVDFLFDLAR